MRGGAALPVSDSELDTQADCGSVPNADVVALETAAIGALAQQNKVWWLWLSEGS